VVEVTDEMRRAVGAEQCARLGHDLDQVVEMATGEPVRLLCGRCGRSWHVEGAGIGGRVENSGGGLVIVEIDRSVDFYPPAGTRVELVARAELLADDPGRAENRAGDPDPPGPLDR
jgi:hypothetical protein